MAILWTALAVLALAGCSTSAQAQDGGTTAGTDAAQVDAADGGAAAVEGGKTPGDDAAADAARAADGSSEGGRTDCKATGYGCDCSNLNGGGSLAACNLASVTAGGAGGFCCNSTDPSGDYDCFCQRIECVTRPADVYCVCSGPMQAQGTLGASCDGLQATNPGVVCCLDPTGCVCSAQACSLIGQEVPNCNADRLAEAICNGSPTVNSCR